MSRSREVADTAQSYPAHVRGYPGGAAVRVAAVLFLLAGVQYLVLEAVAASAWTDPPYSYVSNYVSDLGVPGCNDVQQQVGCSPLYTVMNTAFIAHGVLTLLACVFLARTVSGRTGVAFLMVATAQSLGFILVGVFPGSAAASADGTVVLHALGASLALVGGGVALILAGSQRRALGLPRWFATTSTVLGVVGLVGVVALAFLLDSSVVGVPERVAFGVIMAWNTVTGTALLSRRKRPRPGRGSARHRLA